MNLLQMSMSGAFFILIVVIFRAVTINKLPKTTFLALWYVALMRLLLPVTFRFPFSVYSMMRRSVPALDSFENGVTNFTTGVLSNQPDDIENAAVPALQNHTLSVPVLPTIWAAFAIIMAGMFLMSYLRCRREFRTALPFQNDFTARWHREHPLRRTMDIRQLTGLSTPLTYGIFHPVILMPKNTDWQNEREAQYILFHEYVHIRRFDAAAKLIASAALCIHWFNPLVWALYIMFNRDIELSCDELVIRHFGRNDRKNYAAALLHLEEQRSNLPPFSNYFSKNAAEERINAIVYFRKKSTFTLVFSVLVVALGAAAIFAMAPKTANKDFKDILLGDAPFLYVSEDAVESKSIHDVPALFDPYDDYIKIWDFAVQDLDGDGKAEVIFTVVGVSNDMGGHLILHQADGKVYGYPANFRTMADLKADGTFCYSDPTGAIESGICSISGFTETGITINKITYGQGTYEGFDTFVVNQQSATEEEFGTAQNAQREKPDAEWYDFTTENIKAAFS